MPDISTGSRQILGGDIAFMAKKKFDGKLVNDEGNLNATTGTLCSLTAGTGKELYLARAKVSTGTQSGSATVELRVNGVVVETGALSANASANSRAHYTQNYEFVSLGHSVSATQIIELNVTVSSMNIEGLIEGFEEDSGSSPLLS